MTVLGVRGRKGLVVSGVAPSALAKANLAVSIACAKEGELLCLGVKSVPVIGTPSPHRPCMRSHTHKKK